MTEEKLTVADVIAAVSFADPHVDERTFRRQRNASKTIRLAHAFPVIDAFERLARARGIPLVPIGAQRAFQPLTFTPPPGTLPEFVSRSLDVSKGISLSDLARAIDPPNAIAALVLLKRSIEDKIGGHSDIPPHPLEARLLPEAYRALLFERMGGKICGDPAHA